MVKSTIKKIQAAALVLPLCLPLQAWAAATDLSNVPLATSSTSTVRPNILFTLDNSGSMGWDWLPDYVKNSSHCKPSTQCNNGMPPFQAGAYNGMAYNPAVTYAPPVNADGTLKTSQGSPWTAVKVDGYGVQSTGTINLVTGYQDMVYCATGYGCKKNGIDTNNPFFLRVTVADNPPAYALPGTMSVPSGTVSGTAALFNGTLNGATTTPQTVFNGTLNNGSPTTTTITLNVTYPDVSISGTTVTLTYNSQTPATPAIATGDTITTSGGSCGAKYKVTNATLTKGAGNTLTYTSPGGSGTSLKSCDAVVKHTTTPVVPVPSISSNNATVTVTLAAAHGLVTGDVVTVANGAGTCDAGYRATGVSVTVVNATRFTYTAAAVLGTASNTSCNITKAVVTPPAPPNGISISGNVVTVRLNSLTDSASHTLATNDVVQVTGAGCGTAFLTGTTPGATVTVIDANTFTYTSATPAGTTGLVCKIDRAIMATTPVAFSTATTQNGAPYEYVIIPVEYCDSLYLTNCVASSTPTTVGTVNYSFPAPVRFCKDAATAALAPGAAGAQISGSTINCQGKFSNVTGMNFQSVRYGLFYRVDVPASRATYGNEVLNATINANGTNITFSNVTVIDRSQRSDCAAPPNCTYAEEMTNFANHYAYYRTRMQMMKTSAGKAFQPMDSRYRIGFVTINENWVVPTTTTGGEWLPVATFDATQKQKWYNAFYSINPGSSTPLREALARAGRYFAGLHGLPGDSITDDPMEYSCQQNFTLLTTDGYWNGTTTSVKNLAGSQMGNQDNVNSGLSQRSYGVYDGGCAAGSYSSGGCADTLADVAQYYYATDLRTAALGNCTSGSATGAALCTAPDPAPTPDTLMNNVPSPNTLYDSATWQHMVTFSLGLADGLMLYQPDYATSTTGDFSKIKTGAAGCNFSGAGTCNWPTPLHDSQSALDDLWHAAVNGRGTFYNARDPVSLSRGLSGALAGMNIQVGAAAASATSSPNITRTDRSIFSSTYRTVKWDGEVVAQLLDPLTGNVPPTTLTTLPALSGISLAGSTVTVTTPAHGLLTGDMVQVANTATGICDPAFNTGGQSQVATVVDANNFTYTGNSAGATTNMQCQISKTGVVWSAQTQLDIKVRADTNPEIRSRFIFTYDQSQSMPLNVSGPNGLKDFRYIRLTPTEAGYFDNKCAFSTLSQCTATNLTAAQIASGNMGSELVPYLRGQQALEQTTPPTAPNPVYRPRDHFMGDSVNAKPAYVRAPLFSFQDITPNTNPLSYATFQANNQTRQAALYIASNDGMLHVFDAGSCLSGVCTTGTGNEMWAYVPRMVMPNLYKLADTSYGNNHTYFVDGSPEVMDIYMDGTATSPSTGLPISSGLATGWHTILVGGLNRGGRGFYALDITNPAVPIGLWEVCADTDAASNPMCAINDPDMGYSYGNPVITKRSSDGKWVVLVTSGYNNISPGTGQGYLYVLDAVSGAILSKIPNGSGTVTTPSGLAKINAWADDGSHNNTTRFVYGGDMNGDVWRFDLGPVPSSLPVLTSISLSVSTVTVNLPAHGLSTGGLIQVANTATGTCDPAFNTSGQSVTVTVVNANQFTYTSINPGGATLNTGCQVLDYPFPMPPPVTRFATLLDPLSAPQPITTRPELGDVNTAAGLIDSLHGIGKPAIFIGTGRYLGGGDLTNTQRQSIYALRDDFSKSGVAAYVGSPRGRGDMVVQTISQATNTSSNLPVDWAVKEGWYADFPDTGERVNLDPFLALGTLIVATNVPRSSACETGGTSFLYQFDFKNGNNIATAALGAVRSQITNALTVGIVVVRLPSGQLRVIATSAAGSKVNVAGYVQGTSATRRTSWRELVQ